MSETINISELVPDDRNFNRHSEYGMSLLEKSVRKFGMGRSILLDKDNRIIAGNGITETAGSIGIHKVRIVETDGNEIIAVKRRDISLDTPEGREMALADNATNAANLHWDKEAITEELGQEIAEGWGLEEGQEIEDNEDKEIGSTVEVKCSSPQEAVLLCGKLTDEGYETKIK